MTAEEINDIDKVTLSGVKDSKNNKEMGKGKVMENGS